MECPQKKGAVVERSREVADVGGVQTRVSVWTVRQKSGRCK